jgi:hypothetical protein
VKSAVGLSVIVMVVGSAAQSLAADQQSCVDVQIGSDRYYHCLNEQMQHVSRDPSSAAKDAPLSARSPAPAVGSFNQSATHERLGSSFGKSVVPQRPPPPVFSSPLVRPK